MKSKVIYLALLVLIINFSLISAGPGIVINQQSEIVPENKNFCIENNYMVYNPWPEDSYVKINITGEVQSIVSSMKAEEKYVPAGTSSKQAIPIGFCFKTPKLFDRDCWLFGKFICKLDCNGKNNKEYSGNVVISEISKNSAGMGSATSASVSGPITLRVKCVSSPRNYSLIILALGIPVAILLIIHLIRKRNKKNKKK